MYFSSLLHQGLMIYYCIFFFHTGVAIFVNGWTSPTADELKRRVQYEVFYECTVCVISVLYAG